MDKRACPAKASSQSLIAKPTMNRKLAPTSYPPIAPHIPRCIYTHMHTHMREEDDDDEEFLKGKVGC